MGHDRNWWKNTLCPRPNDHDHQRRHKITGDDTAIMFYDRHTHSRFPIHIWLRINDLAILLRPNERMYVMSQLHVDQSVVLSLQATDVFGNLVDATFENTQWANSDETAAVSTTGADGNSLSLVPAGNAVGKSTTVNMTTNIGGAVFTASVTESIVAGDVAAVAIVETFSPKQAPAATPAAPKV